MVTGSRAGHDLWAVTGDVTFNVAAVVTALGGRVVLAPPWVVGVW